MSAFVPPAEGFVCGEALQPVPKQKSSFTYRWGVSWS